MTRRDYVITAAIVLGILLLFALLFPYIRRADYMIRADSLVQETIREMVKPECLVGSPVTP